jgi:hypothetical protein
MMLLTKADCTRCRRAEMMAGRAGLPLEMLDIETIDGMALGAMYEVLEAELPVFIDDDREMLLTGQDAVDEIARLST